MEKAQTIYAAKIQEIVEKDEKFTWDLIGGYETNILSMMIEVVSMCSDKCMHTNISNMMTSEDALQIKKVFLKTGNNCKRNLNNNIENYRMKLLNPYFNSRYAILEVLSHNNTKILSYIIFESVLIAQSNIEKLFKYACMTYFSTMCCIINHWAIQRLSKIQIFKGNPVRGVFFEVKCRTIDNIKIPDDALDFLRILHDEKAFEESVNFVNKIYSQGEQVKAIHDAVQETLINVTKHIRLNSKKYNHLVRAISVIKDSISDQTICESVLYNIVDKRFTSSCTAATASTFGEIYGFGHIWNMQMIDLYIYMLHLKGIKIFNVNDEVAEKQIDYASRYNACIEDLWIRKLLSDFGIHESDRLIKSKSEINLMIKRENERENKIAYLSKEVKRLKKDLASSEGQRQEVEKLLKQREDKKGVDISAKDEKDYLDQLCLMQSRIDSSISTIGDLNRSIQKKDREILHLQDKLKISKEKNEDTEQKYQKEKERANKLSVDSFHSSIPIYSYINAIKKYKIALVGGDMMANKLINEYGLTNIRMYKAGCRNISYEGISDMRLVVVITAFIDHSTEDGAMNACRRHKIPCLKFNYKNVEMLIYSIFSELYK